MFFPVSACSVVEPFPSATSAFPVVKFLPFDPRKKRMLR
jgi:hypothetical protein